MARGSSFAWLALLGMSLPTSACDLLEFAKNPAVTFQLPEQKFVIRNQEWKQPPPTFNNPILCAQQEDCCKIPGAPAGTPPAFDCNAYSLVCDAGQCAMTFLLEMAKTVDLAKEAPALAQMKGKVVSDIVLQSLQYSVNNQLTVALPPLSVYVAPARVTTVMGNADAKHLTTVPMVPASVQWMDTAPLNDAGQKAFSTFARDFQTPFNFIANATFVMRSGTPPPPQSEIQVSFTGSVTARF